MAGLIKDNFMDKQFYTVKETADLLRVTTLTIYRNTESGKIPSIKIGSRKRIPASYIQRIIDDALGKSKNI